MLGESKLTTQVSALALELEGPLLTHVAVIGHHNGFLGLLDASMWF